MRTTIALIAGLAVAGPLAPTAAPGASKQRCPVPAQARLVAGGSGVAVWRQPLGDEGSTFTACAKRSGKRTVLFEGENTPDSIRVPESLTVAGPFVAYVDVDSSRGSYFRSSLVRFNADKGRATYSQPISTASGAGEGSGTEIKALRVNVHGDLAWQTFTVRFENGTYLVSYALHVRDGLGLRTLADGAEPLSDVALGATTVRWTQQGRRMFADLRRPGP